MKKIWEKWIRFLNVRIYGDCGTPIWRCPETAKYLRINITQVLQMWSTQSTWAQSPLIPWLWCSFQVFAYHHITSVQLLSVWRIKSPVWQFDLCFIPCSSSLVALSRYLSFEVTRDFMSLHTAFYFQSSKLCIAISFSIWSKRQRTQSSSLCFSSLWAHFLLSGVSSADSRIWTAGCHRSTAYGQDCSKCGFSGSLNTPV